MEKGKAKPGPAKRRAQSADVSAAPPPSAQRGPLDRFFGLSLAGTSVSTELRAGLATFLTMAYIMFVNPAILEKAGMDQRSVVVGCVKNFLVMPVPTQYYITVPLTEFVGTKGVEIVGASRSVRRNVPRS